MNLFFREGYIKLFIIALVLVSVFVAPGCKTEKVADDGWRFLGAIQDENGDAVGVFLDTTKIEVKNGKRTFWVKYVANTNPNQKPKSPEDTYIRQTGFWEVDCFDRSLERVSEEYYDSAGKLLGKTTERMKEEYDDKGSIGAKMADMACRYGGK